MGFEGFYFGFFFGGGVAPESANLGWCLQSSQEVAAAEGVMQ